MESFTIFILASLALIVTPGPDIFYVLTRGMAGGRRSGVVSAVGVTAGILVHTMAAALGLAVLLQTSVYAFWALKIAGGVYLIHLGYQMIKNRQAFEFGGLQTGMGMRKCFLQGFLSNVLNPKVALFFVAFLPQFVSRESASQSWDMMIILGLVFAAMTIAFLVALGLFSGLVGKWLKTRKAVAGGIRIGSGVALILLGGRLLLPQND